MLNGVKSVAYYTALGAATGAAIGAGVGLVNAPARCGVFEGVFLDRFFNGLSPSELYCRTLLPMGAAASCGLVGAAIGLIYGVSKEIFKNYGVQIQPTLQLQRSNIV